MIVSRLRERFPDDGILSEELEDDRERLRKRRVWCIDPLDSTRQYITGTSDFSVILSLAEKGTPIMGLLYRPAERKFYFAVKSEGAFSQVVGQDPVRIRVSRTDFSAKRLLILISDSRGEKAIKELEAKVPKAWPIKMSGSVKTCIVAKGEADAFLLTRENLMRDWDLCGPQVILEEAGGRLTDLEGRTIEYNQKYTRQYGLLASNGVLHNQLLVQMRGRAIEAGA